MADSKIARVKNNGGMLIVGELIEGSAKLSVSSDGNLYVDDFVEGSKFNFGGVGGNDIEVVDFEENVTIV